MEERLLLRAEEAAQLLGLGRSKVFELIARGELPSVTIGRARRVPLKALAAWVEERASGAAANRDGVA